MADVRPQLHAVVEAMGTDCTHLFPQIETNDPVSVQAILADLRMNLDQADALAAQMTPPAETTAPVWTDFAPPPAKVGVPYSYQFKATGATHYALIGGAPPPVIGFDQYSGIISGNALWPGSYTFSLRAENAVGVSYQFGITMTVTA